VPYSDSTGKAEFVQSSLSSVRQCCKGTLRLLVPRSPLHHHYAVAASCLGRTYFVLPSLVRSGLSC
jgi:hypothetical protein